MIIGENLDASQVKRLSQVRTRAERTPDRGGRHFTFPKSSTVSAIRQVLVVALISGRL